MPDVPSAATGRRNPWVWIPSLYFAQGIPYVMVMTVSVIMYKRLGISNTDIALYTSWLYLPWVIKPLWSPLVDLLGTKRLWTVVMQGAIAVTLAGVAFTIPASSFFQYTIALFWMMAFCSATHDIAADGFYMLGLRQHQQAAFVGVRSTFYRIAIIAAQGLLVMFAGVIETRSGLAPVALNVATVAGAPNAAFVLDAAPPTTQAAERLELMAAPARVEMSTGMRPAAEIDALLAQVRARNAQHGFAAASVASAGKSTQASWWRQRVSGPLGEFLTTHFGEPRQTESAGAGNVGVATLRLSAKPQPGQRVVVVLTHAGGEGRIEIAEGARLIFDETNWDKPAYVAFKSNPKLRAAAAATFTTASGNIPLAWTTVAAVLAALFALFCLYHLFILPYPAADGPAARSGMDFLGEFFRTFHLFFQRRDIGVVLGFLLFFRFAEAQLVKLVSPFLLDPRDVGGLGLTTGEVGLAYGTFGIAALTIGGILGGVLIARHGLRSWLWPMVLIMHLPDLAFVYLAYQQPENFALITAAVMIEQFGYGFGFTAYMLYMIMVAEGAHKTAHYAICTGIMALGMMVPGMFSGWLQEHIGYKHFFVWVLISTIPGFLVAALVRIDPQFGRKHAEA